jgi:hypothetical protein
MKLNRGLNSPAGPQAAPRAFGIVQSGPRLLVTQSGFFFVYSYSHEAYIDYGGVHF